MRLIISWIKYAIFNTSEFFIIFAYVFMHEQDLSVKYIRNSSYCRMHAYTLLFMHEWQRINYDEESFIKFY